MLQRKDSTSHDEMYLGAKICMYPTESQKERLFELIDLYRYVYNWALAFRESYYKRFLEGEEKFKWLSDYDMSAEYSKLIANEDYNWLRERMPRQTARNAIKDVEKSFNKFFENYSGYPRFKTFKRSVKSFKPRVDRCYIKDGKVKVEGFGYQEFIDLKYHGFDGYGYNYLGKPLDVPIYDVSIKYESERFWLCFKYPIKPTPLEITQTDVIGIDLGIRQTMVLSNGEIYMVPDVYKETKKIQMLDRAINRDRMRRRRQARALHVNISEIKKSNSELERESLRRRYYKDMHNKRFSFYHQSTSKIVNTNPRAIVMETFHVTRIMRDAPYLAAKLHQVAFYSITDMFRYKCEKNCIPFLQADENYPSSKICSKCGAYNDTLGSKKIFKCKCCGNTIDRDLNAAINLKHLWVEQ